MNFFSQVRDSFLNFDAYKEFARQKGGKTFKYFVLLFTLVFLIGGLRFVNTYNTGVSELAAAVKEQVPEFRLENGELTVEGQQPIILGGENNSVLVIDTTGQTESSILDQYLEGVYIDRNSITVKQDYNNRVVNFSAFREVVLDKDKLVSKLPLLKWLLVIIAFFSYGFKMGWVLITTVILALLGLIINSSMKGGLEFGNLWTISVYAFTLPWLLEMVKELVYPGLPLFWAAKWGLAIYILYKGIEAANTPVSAGELPEPPEEKI